MNAPTPYICIKEDTCIYWTRGPYTHSQRCEQKNALPDPRPETKGTT